MSGVSGGSLGLATYAAHLTEQGARQDPDLLASGMSSDSSHWVRERLGADNLAPSLGWMLFVEAPWSLLRFKADKDRARVLEEAWERASASDAGPGLRQDLFALNDHQAPAEHRVPLLLFNGTSVESGCRFDVSVLDANGRDRGDPAARCLSQANLERPAGATLSATNDLVDFLCEGEDVWLSKAALLSARFPVISPSGHLEQCGPVQVSNDPAPLGGLAATRHPPETFVVDGGYLDGSAAATAVELWDALAPMVMAYNDAPNPAYIAPFFIQIDNGYGQPAGPGAVPAKPQALVPLLATKAAIDGRKAMARQAAQLSFSQPFRVRQLDLEAQGHPVCRYANFALRAHPGAQAPLGWTLSSESFDDLVAQFEQANTPPPGSLARAAPLTPLQQVDGWFHLKRTAIGSLDACSLLSPG
jgi:hypothetical protein